MHNFPELNDTKEGLNFCGCCDDSVKRLQNLSLEDRLQGTNNEGMKEILQATNMDDLKSNGKELVNWCIDFLIYSRSGCSFPKSNLDQIHPNKYITIWSFVYNFLKIPKDSGYDYWLLSFLE